MASNTFGATVVSTTNHQDPNLAPSILDSPALTPVASRDPHNAFTSDKPIIPPHSPFYQHPPASHERMPFPATLQTPPSKKSYNIHEKDLESNPTTPFAESDTNPFTSKVSVDHAKECAMWPSRKTLEMNRLAERKQKLGGKKMGFAEVRHKWATATGRQKWTVRVVLAALVVGAIVAIAVGVTKAVHGGVYKSDGRTGELGNGQ